MNNSVNMSQWHDMQKLCKKMIFFSIPFGMVFLVNYIVDPFAISSPVNMYRATTQAFDERLWKLNYFKLHPTCFVVLGDSRAGLLSEKLMQEITGETYTNMALSGATLMEIIDTFWFATQHSVLKKVFFGINFDRFNDWQTASGVRQAITVIDNPLLYYTRPQTLKASWSIIKASIMQSHTRTSQAPPLNKESFWNYQIDEIDTMYHRFVDSVYIVAELKKMAYFCREHGIELYFVVLPTHTSLQERIDMAGLRSKEQKFKETIGQLGTLYDLDFPNDFTKDASYFSDPKHCTSSASDEIVRMVWGGQQSKYMVMHGISSCCA